MKTVVRLLAVLLPLLLGACATHPFAPAATPETAKGITLEPEGWWRAQFRFARDADEPPRWYLGTLVAGEVIAPVFEGNYQDILIWRIHRRAGDDKHGHVLSFVFYSTPSAAQRIYKDIEQNPVLAKLRSTGQVSWVGYTDTAVNREPRVEDTSDPAWPEPIRKTWPAMIMGASRMWLDMVGELADAHVDEPDLEARYQLVQKDMDALWASEGQHAVLHHLSALFAYQPLQIRY